MSARADGTLERHGGYTTAEGPRELLSVFNPDTGRYLLVDSFEQTVAGDLDPRIVDDELDSPEEVEALARDYLPRAWCRGRPWRRHERRTAIRFGSSRRRGPALPRLRPRAPTHRREDRPHRAGQLRRRLPGRLAAAHPVPATPRDRRAMANRRRAPRGHPAALHHARLQPLDVGAVVGSTAEPPRWSTSRASARARRGAHSLGGPPERKRRLYLLKVLGFTYDEIGVITGDSYSTVNRQLVRAAALIRRARGAH
jgi:hypothetical protein